MGRRARARKPPSCGLVLIEHGPQGYAEPRVIDAAAADTGGRI
jgi:hypothetical protein